MLNKISVKELIQFSRYSERRQLSFAKRMQRPKPPRKDESSGGNYWVTSISALSAAFKELDNSLIKDKIEDLRARRKENKNFGTRQQYQRNIDILSNYEDFDFSLWGPPSKLNFIRSKSNEPIVMKNIPIRTTPNQVFWYGNKDAPSIGAVTFVAWLEGFTPADLGSYSEGIYKYLSEHYPKYHIDPNFCFVVDTFKGDLVNYNQVLEREIPSSLKKTVALLDKYLR